MVRGAVRMVDGSAWLGTSQVETDAVCALLIDALSAVELDSETSQARQQDTPAGQPRSVCGDGRSRWALRS